ncbi:MULTISPECIES: type II secretion system protein N [unclassified Thioalkalivibrio]|uniref:type II secretion system protein N n=1 Tax=unclassified Thioalkalivibrio TaxID=2621013 RepID=UPI000374C0E0|nr:MULTISPECIES: type II secretion system protein N [unclassified Thioalkalivibrio]PYG04224.1 general secretion pathway protein C [Thioalkalivibrio sp. ALE21]
MHTRLPRLLNLALAVMLAWMTAGLVWLMLAPEGVLPPPDPAAAPTDTTHSSSPASATTEAGEDRASGFSRSARHEPFGPLETATPAPVEQAPETRLQLDLKGVLADGHGDGTAFIAAGGRDIELYRPDDTIGEQMATLDQVHPDHVVLLRDGRHEILRLPRGEDPRIAGNGADRSAEPSPATSSADGRISRDRWLNDPERVMDAVRARPVIRQGSLAGLEVRPTRNRRDFERTGLRPGDIITSVGGREISAIEDPETLLADLQDARRVDITVERDGQARSLSIEFTE